MIARSDVELRAEIKDLEREILPLQQQVMHLRARVDVVRTELRRRERQEQLKTRQATRAELASGELPSLEDIVSGAVTLAADAPAFDDLRFLRESATEVRLGYSSSSRQAVSFTDGRETEDAHDVAGAWALWARGWDFGSPQARGVRVYPVGSRAERVVPAAEIHVDAR